MKVYYDLLKVPVKNKKQARVVELTHMALGRLHYHRDQPSEAIEQYLQVSRKSDLFDDALYEVAFVYVKSRQFDKALRALELLEMATGGSCARPNARVNTMHEVWAHPQLKARERWREVGSPAGVLPAMLPPGSWNEGPRMDPVPALGEHTDAILRELGLDAESIHALRAAEAI